MDRTVIHIANFSTPHSGGFVSSLESLGAYAKTQGFNLILIFPAAAQETQWAGDMQKNGYRLYFLPSNPSLFALIRTIRQITRSEKADIIHAHFSNYNFHACVVSLLLSWEHKKVRTIWHFHSDWKVKLTLKRKIKDFILYKILGQSAYGIAVSQDIKANIVSRGMPHQRIFYVPNGFDINRVTSSSAESRVIRQEIGIPEQKIIFLAFGWEPITKGVDLLLNAFEILVMQHKEVALFLVGTEIMEQYVANWTRGVYREWLVLAKPREKVADFYKISSVFVSASRSEGFPYSVAEAMAARLPIVSSNIPGLDWAKNVEGVVFFESGNEIALAHAMEKVLAWSEAERVSKTSANNKFIIENYSMGKWAKNIVEVYKTILGDPPSVETTKDT